MSEYRDYTIDITLNSPIVTAFQSDTIFGHICWAIRFLKWNIDDKLTDFLMLYENRELPPLLISNGFPKYYLPKPILPPVTQEILEDIFKKEDRIKNAFRIKTIKNSNIIPKEKFKEFQQGEITSEKLFKTMNDCFEEIQKLKEKEQSTIVQHNTISRIGGKVEGGLYSQEEIFFDNNGGMFEVYLKTNYFSLKELNSIFTYISEGGFGRDKSTGKGSFTFKITEGIDLPEVEKPNAFMTLSSYIPTKDDPTSGYYNIIHKFGKLGGLYAKGGNPFKVPLIMFSSGSVFLDKGYRQGKVYGSLLRDVHQNKDIRHYAYAFPVGIQIKENYEEV